MSASDAVCPVDLGSDRTEIVVDPRSPALDVRASAAALERLHPLRAHVWVRTSGTTGPAGARWVALSKEAILASARAVNRHLLASGADS